MSKVNDGGPAFPLVGFPGDPNYTLPVDGMTLRQWYAGQVLSQTARHIDANDAATLSVRYADALIAELEKETHE